MFKNVLSCIAGIMLFLISASYIACKDKKTEPAPNACTGVVCKNSGVCVDGKCSCALGYEGDFCEKRWVARYLGTWEMKEVIISSSDSSRENNDTVTYVTVIKEKDGNPVRIFFDDFMGNSNYDNVSCELGLNKKGGAEPSDRFIFTYHQSVANSYITINTGNGEVNDFGTVILGNYSRTAIIDSIPVTDTLNFVATLKQ